MVLTFFVSGVTSHWNPTPHRPTPRQIRLLFLLHKYNTPMDYGDDAMSGALAAEKIFSEFFHNVKAALRRTTARVRTQASKKPELSALYSMFAVCIRNIVGVTVGGPVLIDSAYPSSIRPA